MKKNILIFLAVVAAVYVLFIHSGITSLTDSPGIPYIAGDEEINYLTALSTYRGEGLYKGFSLVYPPGRFLLQAALFHIVSPTVPAARFYFHITPLFFVVFFFFLCYKIFLRLGSKSPIAYGLATIATFAYSALIHSAQEVHAFVALFFLVSLSDFRKETVKNTILGILLGCVFLFRIDTGVLLLISLLIFKMITIQNVKDYILGFGIVWAPMLLYIAAFGSLQNFLYDALYLGLIIQPKTMSLAIPPAPLGQLFYAILIFLMASSISLSIEAASLRPFALFSLMSFVAALGRSDEGHLWYGAIWSSFYVAYLIHQFLDKENMQQPLKIILLPMAGAFFGLGYFLIGIKNYLFFIASCAAILFFSSRLKKRNIMLIMISGLIASFMIFHSVSYLRLRLIKPTFTPTTTLAPGLFTSDSSEIAGLKFSNKDREILKKAKTRLDKKNEWLFIYPSNVIFYEYFGLKNPTRQYYHTGETTEKLQNEIIADFEKSNITNFIVFPEKVIGNRKVWRWIKRYTYIDATFVVNGEKMHIRKKK